MKSNFKKSIALLLALVMLMGMLAGCGGKEEEEILAPIEAEQISDKPVISEPVTLNVLTTRHPGTTTDADDLWFFKYMELWFAEQGYDVTINVQQTNESAQQISLLLGTDSLPDIIWGIPVSRTDIMQYAVEEGMLMEWTPYLNETLMPNLTKVFAEQPEILESATAPNNGVYALPYLTPAQYASGCYGTSERLYFRQSWLDEVGMENPTTEEELLNVLRAFKNVQTESGHASIPLISAGNFLEKYLWTGLGFYGTEPNKYGSNLMIKDGELVLPAYTEDYRHFIELMKTFYDEDIIADDYFSMDDATAGGLMQDNTCGAFCWWTLEYIGDDFADAVCANPILLGDNDSIHVSRLDYYKSNYMWASSKTEHPELVAMMFDFIYSEEGAMTYRYGPKQGEDPLGLVDGWYFDEAGNITTAMVADGTYATMANYGRDRLFPIDNAGLRPAVVTNGSGEMIEFTDSVTGETYTCLDNYIFDHSTSDGHWRLITIEKWSDRATSVRLPGAYLTPDENDTVADISTILSQHITNESAKFITGQRSLDEIDKFWEELEGLGVEEYLQIERTAYADYMAETFG